ncbi:MAG: NYN domain-containing protein [Candidatus Heimdallarchaeaceae archaeon]
MPNAFTPTTKVYQTFPQKAVVIIDGGYWETIRKSMGNPEIDLVKFSEDLCKPAYRLRTYYFDGKSEERQSIHDQLEMNERFEVILGDVVPREIRCPYCKKFFVRNEQKRVDVQLATSLVHFASSKQADLIVLLAGDRDFLPVVEIAKDEMVVVKLVYGSDKLSGVAPGLLKSADERVKITEELLRDYLLEGSDILKAEKIVEEEISVFDEDKIKKITQVLAKTLRRKRVKCIRASSFGSILKREKIIYEGQIKDFNKLTNGKVIISGEGSDIFVSLEKEIQKELLKDFEPKKDPAVIFMLEALRELQLEENKKEFNQNILSTRMWVKNPNWVEDFEIDEPNAFSRLIEWASELLNIKGKKGNWIIGIKE